jgi:hypothetical protein
MARAGLKDLQSFRPMARPPKFTAEDRPRYIVDAAGQWLAAELGGGFRWVASSRALKVQVSSTATAEVVLRPSHWNYTGVLTVASIRVTVRDRALAAWRRSRGRRHSGFITETSPDVMWSWDLINLYRDLYNVELFGDVAANSRSGVRYLTLPELLEGIRTRILPKLLTFESPARAANELPDFWLAEPEPLVEWARSLSDEDSARLFRTRADKLLRRLPPDTPLEGTLAAGRELLEMLQSEARHFREYRDGNLPDELVSQGIELLMRWIGELSDPEGRTERVPDGSLTRWASQNLGPPSPIRQKAIEFEAAAMALR